MLESKFKAKQREYFEAKGWKFVQFGNEAGTGFPDTLCLAPNGYHCFIEWKKSEKASRQPLQMFWNKKLNDMGHDAFFVYPENLEKCKQWMNSKT